MRLSWKNYESSQESCKSPSLTVFIQNLQNKRMQNYLKTFYYYTYNIRYPVKHKKNEIFSTNHHLWKIALRGDKIRINA